MKPVISTIVTILFISTLSAFPAFAATIHVPGDHATIQDGIHAAADGDLILVAPGTYVENIDFIGKAITVRSWDGADVTIIDGNRVGSVVVFANGETEGAIINGFTIRNGAAEYGGGIYCNNSSPTITNCTITGNSTTGTGADSDGGGIYCNDSFSTITNCTISGNFAEDYGGGISCYYSDPTITNCTITRNSATGIYGYGGGISCYYSDPMVTNCTISENGAYSGGGIRCYHSDPMVTNCTVSGNSAEGGGGIFFRSSFSTVTNCILWGNDAHVGPEINLSSGSVVVTYSDVQGGWPGEGNIDSDPLFIGGGDYHLTVGSPCIDAGTDAGIYMDIDGDERPQGAGIDMGSDEYPECWDGDMDGYGDVACGGFDCDDTDPGVNPGTQEVCTGGIDEDCDGFIDSDDPDCVTIHVPADQPTIQSAIDMAADRCLVLVAPGTYVENIDFLGKEITLRSEAGADETIIHGNQAGSVVTFSIGVTEDAVIDGFMIRNGAANYGGGIYCKFNSPTIANCTISGNRAEGDGGGIYCYCSNSTITNCAISGNITEDNGGGIYLEDGSPTITNCTISGNIAEGDGGGIYCEDSPSTIMNSTISGNIAEGLGGGISCFFSPPTITNCTISSNIAKESGGGGGISCSSSAPPTITNCTISGNSATGYDTFGGGISCSSSATITNCTISGNSATGRGGGIYCSSSDATITNCILWGNYAPNGPEIYLSSGSVAVTYSDVQGGWPGEGNIDSDPLFIGEVDYHLTAGSPCIDTGIDIGVYTDIEGDARPQGAGFDMGSDEYTEYWDGDMDGYGDVACGGTDCDDTDPGVNPGAQEICAGGIDEDCDGFIDSDDPDCVTIHVPADQPTIQSAIDMAADGSLVVVAPGTYVENIYFFGKSIILRSEAGADETVIDGNQAGSVVTFSSGETEETVIDGFTIRNGAAYKGGGINCYYSHPTITNCTISGNIASYHGGGICCDDASPTITNCTITGNITEDDGGGISCYDSDPTITNCMIAGNITEDDGGGIYCYDSDPTIRNCTISRNSATGTYSHGGGIYCYDSDPRITNCTISGNSAYEGGGGIYWYYFSSPYITNCTISGNSADKGGGIYCGSLSHSAIRNCTILGNSAYGGGGIYCDGSRSFPMIENCIIWADSATLGTEIYIAFVSAPTVSYSDVQGGEAAVFVEPGGTLHWGDGNIDSDPLFVGGGDHHLTSGSPCIDAGTDAGVYTDMDGEARPQGDGYDMGADEYLEPDCRDLDLDGYGDQACGGSDCDDTDPDVYPGAIEICDNGIDDDCDGLVDANDPDCGQKFTLEMDASYAAGTLSMNFTIGKTSSWPTTWETYLILISPTVQVIPLWDIPLPAIHPPIDIPISFPFPSLGWIGLYSNLYAKFSVQVMDLEWVDTGLPGQ